MWGVGKVVDVLLVSNSRREHRAGLCKDGALLRAKCGASVSWVSGGSNALQKPWMMQVQHSEQAGCGSCSL